MGKGRVRFGVQFRVRVWDFNFDMLGLVTRFPKLFDLSFFGGKYFLQESNTPLNPVDKKQSQHRRRSLRAESSLHAGYVDAVLTD